MSCMSYFQITASHFRGDDSPYFSTDRFQKSNKSAVCVPVLVCQGGEKVMACWTKVK